MLPYWLFFILPAAMALQAGPINHLRSDGSLSPTRVPAVWFIVLIGLTLIIGLRYEVGGDWRTYFGYLFRARALNLSDLLTVSDPGYVALNMLSNWLGLGMTGVNTFGGLIFAIGLIVFCRSLPRPWLALSCAMPYLVTVVAMGYTRQGIAVGIAMIGLVALRKSRYKRFAVWILFAAAFHKSAIILIPIAAMVIDRNRLQVIGVVGLLGYAGYDAFLASSVARLTYYYQDDVMQSSGALIRLAMNAVPAVLMLYFRKRFAMTKSEKRLWIIFSLISILMFIAFFPTGLSTALDRIALYFIPLQLVVFAHLPDVIGRQGGRNQGIVAGVLVYYAAVLFGWLNFAAHSTYWLPYRVGIV